MELQFDERQPKLQVYSRDVMICLDEEEVTEEGTTKYKYNVEAFTLTDGQTLKEEVRKHMLFLINEYDHSSKVDGFYVNGQWMWLDFNLRGKVRERINTDVKDGKTVSSFTFDGVKYEFPIDTLNAMMFELDKYARDSWDRSEENRANMNTFDDPYKMVEYEFKLGYPAQLNFNK